MRLRVLLFAVLIACGKRSSTPPPQKAKVVPPPQQSPPGVIGCLNSYVAIPNEANTDYVIVQVNHDRFGSDLRVSLDEAINGVNVTLETYEHPIARVADAYCTDLREEPQHAHRYFAVGGEVTVQRRGDLVNVVLEKARFVDKDGHIVDVARRECSNVVVGWASP
jgi:hypothetical protein